MSKRVRNCQIKRSREIVVGESRVIEVEVVWLLPCIKSCDWVVHPRQPNSIVSSSSASTDKSHTLPWYVVKSRGILSEKDKEE